MEITEKVVVNSSKVIHVSEKNLSAYLDRVGHFTLKWFCALRKTSTRSAHNCPTPGWTKWYHRRQGTQTLTHRQKNRWTVMKKVFPKRRAKDNRIVRAHRVVCSSSLSVSKRGNKKAAALCQKTGWHRSIKRQQSHANAEGHLESWA